MRFAPKTPLEVKDYALDWSDRLIGAESIVASGWTYPAGLTEPSPDENTTTQTKVWLTGGTPGTRYLIVNGVVTSAGRTYEQAFSLWITDPTMIDEAEEVRFHLGDTDPARPQVDDDDIYRALTAQRGRPRHAARDLAIHLAARWAKTVSRSIDGLTINTGEFAARYKTLADLLTAEIDREKGDGAFNLMLPATAGHVSVDGFFRRGMFADDVNPSSCAHPNLRT